MKKLGYLWLFCFTSLMFAQTTKIQVKTSTTSLKLGDQFKYSFKVKLTDKLFVPTLTLGNFEIVDKVSIDTVGNQKVVNYVLTNFKEGKQYIPSQTIYINQKKFVTDSLMVSVVGMKIDSNRIHFNEKVHFYEKDPFTFKEFMYRFGWWILFVIVLIGVVYFVYRYVKNKPKEVVVIQEVKEDPYEVAKQKIASLVYQNFGDDLEAKHYYTNLTDIVKHYLKDELTLATLELTSEELLAMLKDFNQQQKLGLLPHHFEELHVLLQQADFVKFAKFHPSENTVLYHQQIANQTIDTIHQLKKQSHD